MTKYFGGIEKITLLIHLLDVLELNGTLVSDVVTEILGNVSVVYQLSCLEDMTVFYGENERMFVSAVKKEDCHRIYYSNISTIEDDAVLLTMGIGYDGDTVERLLSFLRGQGQSSLSCGDAAYIYNS